MNTGTSRLAQMMQHVRGERGGCPDVDPLPSLVLGWQLGGARLDLPSPAQMVRSIRCRIFTENSTELTEFQGIAGVLGLAARVVTPALALAS